MNAALLLSLVGIAIFDSLNPSLFVAQFYLLTTPQPVPRVLSYIGGVLLVNLGGGVLLVAGAGAVLVAWISAIPRPVLFGGILALGVALVLFALWYAPAPVNTDAPKPRSLQLGHTFLLGVAVMLNELTTALPYFIAIERIVQANLSTLSSLTALALYNLVFSLPLLLFVGLFAHYGGRFAAQLEQITRWLQVWMPRMIKYGSLLFGVVLLIEGAAQLVWGRGFIW